MRLTAAIGRAALALTSGLVLLLGTTGTAGAAPSTISLDPAATSLPGCAVTLMPSAGSYEGMTCLVPSAQTSEHGVMAMFVQIAQNGPWPPSSGWVITVSDAQGTQINLSAEHNNQASSWASSGNCGYFHVNGAGTPPWQPFPRNTQGNFPWGVVGNDQLSGISLWSCA